MPGERPERNQRVVIGREGVAVIAVEDCRTVPVNLVDIGQAIQFSLIAVLAGGNTTGIREGQSIILHTIEARQELARIFGTVEHGVDSDGSTRCLFHKAVTYFHVIRTSRECGRR